MALQLFEIANQTVGSGGAASITFASIPQGYTDLILKTSLRTTTADASLPQKFTTVSFNGSTANQTQKTLYAQGATVASNSSTAINLWACSNLTTANSFSNGEMYIPNYTSSSFKTMQADIVIENNATNALITPTLALWSNTSAITSITLGLDTGLFVQYSTATLYGIL